MNSEHKSEGLYILLEKGGERVVVEDRKSSDSPYAKSIKQDLSERERYEVRSVGHRDGLFAFPEEALEYVEEQFDFDIDGFLEEIPAP